MKLTKHKTALLIIFFTAFAVGVITLYVYLKHSTARTPQINEIAFNQDDKIDWIEIYNPTMNNLSLKGLYLSDNPKDYQKFKIKEQVIAPSNGFVLIYCQGYEGEGIKSNFRIANGETVYLVSPDGKSILDSMTAIINDKEVTNFSIGRFPDGNEEIFLMSHATPGTDNIKDPREDWE